MMKHPLSADRSNTGLLFAMALPALALLFGPVAAQEARDHCALPAPEERIARDPFPIPAVQEAIAAGLSHALEQSRNRRLRTVASRGFESLLPDVGHHSMGWNITDEEYWNRIPVEARSLPSDWSGLPAVEFTNTEIAGVRTVRLRQTQAYDQWLLTDPSRDLTACISVDRKTRRVYFMEVARRSDGTWNYAAPFDNCYSCHASGPRVIRPLKESRVDRRILEAFNRQILAYGPCKLGSEVDNNVRGDRLDDARCEPCHNGAARAPLYGIHDRAIAFKTLRDLTMPP